MLNAQHINKSYQHDVLTDVNVTLKPGTIYGLFGRNGIGKTTLLKILSNHIVHYQGEVHLDGKVLKENDPLTSQVYLSLDYTDPTLEHQKLNNLISFAAASLPHFDASYLEQLMGTFNLNPKAKLKSLSKGTRILFFTLLGLASGAPYTFFDEPTAGLDPANKELLFKQIQAIRDDGRCVVIATHDIGEMERLVDHVLILNADVVLDASMEEIADKAFRVFGDQATLDAHLAGKNILGRDTFGGKSIVYIYDTLAPTAQLDIAPLSLKDLFIYLTGGNAHVES
ncbi:ABC transporter ATP-binding protein [Peptoniphilus equinus]|uniref:ABC transporter ATP-binding protein n=1 Tax=Peptoniphilus equinus TaxID=3016343 RepID=A0ABY7QTE9_9FIRM|nr:ABC transporter ATP-binding protein [Peptoniphilus equinus]WBW50049.1 ABC transporter ATP-binding protein [Peptoniphilus equinus]